MNDATEQIDIDDHSVDLCLMATVLHDFDEMDKSGAVLEYHLPPAFLNGVTFNGRFT